MWSIRKNIIVVLSAYLLCDLTVGSQSDYDVGCYRESRSLFELHGFIALIEGWLPSCVAGGLFKHVQCTSSLCYCAYFDNGRKNTDVPYTTFKYSYEQLSAYCPRIPQYPRDTCDDGPLQYPCLLNETKYKYDADSNSCQPTYGCYGYTDREECEEGCAHDECSYPTDRGQYCSTRSNDRLRYRHNPTNERCEPFIYRGCGGNTNNYNNRWECERSCGSLTFTAVTLRVAPIGIFTVDVPRWIITRFHLSVDQVTDVTQDDFQTIGENGENLTLGEIMTTTTEEPTTETVGIGIEQTLSKKLTELPKFCELPSKTGPCRAYFSRWYYDTTTETCTRFTYGGCLANDNNFKTFSDCFRECGGTPPTPTYEEIHLYPPTVNSNTADSGTTGTTGNGTNM